MNKRDRVAVKRAQGSERERVSLVLPSQLKTALMTVATREVRTLNQQCEVLLKRGLEDMGVAV